MNLGAALRVWPPASGMDRGANRAGVGIAFVGAGGKTTALFKLARESAVPALVTATTHLGAWQTDSADSHIIARNVADWDDSRIQPVTLVTGPIGSDQRTQPVPEDVLLRLRDTSLANEWPLLIEADGSRQKPLKAPASTEPQIPEFVEIVVVVVGMLGLRRSLSNDSVHRPEIFARLAGLPLGALITPQAIGKALLHPDGGLKGIPMRARRIALLNQADTPSLQAQASQISKAISAGFEATLVASLRSNTVHAVHEPCAGVVLAAGDATRFHAPKQLLPWQGEPLVRTVAATALQAGLTPVIVVTGAAADQVEGCLENLPVLVARNENWRDGQSSSLRAGLALVPPAAGSAVFLLADQPHVAPEVIHALVEAHVAGLPSIVAPLIQGNRRGNPVLFDRRVFPDLASLRGDVGGRAIFSKHQVVSLPWHDESLLADIDTPEDYRRLRPGESQ
jgi:molybdenum cofactor cytidylyltransferase